MTNEVIEMSTLSASEEVVRPESPGSRLRKARESRHLSVEEMAKRLRYNPLRVHQLENDDYHLMGAATFARGYLRSYAGQLNFSKEEILDILKAFDQLDLGASIAGHKPQLIREEIKQVNPKWARRIGYLVVILLVVLVAAWWYTNHTMAASKPADTDASDTASNASASDANSANAAGKVQLEIVPLQQNGSDAANSGMVELPLPTLQTNRVAPTSRTPVQTPSQSTPQNANTAAPVSSSAAKPASRPATAAKPGG